MKLHGLNNFYELYAKFISKIQNKFIGFSLKSNTQELSEYHGRMLVYRSLKKHKKDIIYWMTIWDRKKSARLCLIWFSKNEWMNVSMVTVIGIVASLGTAMSMVPQLTKLIKEKKADDISIYMLIVLFAGIGCWIAYGVLKGDWIIIISNSFSFLVNLALTILTLRYKVKNWF